MPDSTTRTPDLIDQYIAAEKQAKKDRAVVRNREQREARKAARKAERERQIELRAPERRERHREYHRTYNDKTRLRKFGMTVEQYAQMFDDQGGLCAICLQPPQAYRLCIDHDHVTGKVRALLCRGCNLTLGATSDPEWFRRAADFLERHAA